MSEDKLLPGKIQDTLAMMYSMVKDLDPDYCIEFMKQIAQVETSKAEAIHSNIRYVEAMKVFKEKCDEIRADAVREEGGEDQFQRNSINRLRDHNSTSGVDRTDH